MLTGGVSATRLWHAAGMFGEVSPHDSWVRKFRRGQMSGPIRRPAEPSGEVVAGPGSDGAPALGDSRGHGIPAELIVAGHRRVAGFRRDPNVGDARTIGRLLGD
jgi:hypothetical protein